MKGLINLLRGVAGVRVCGPFPERLLNLCAQHRLTFWGVVLEDANTVLFQIRPNSLRRLKVLGERIGCTIEVEDCRGLVFFLGRFRRRYAFLVGLVCSLLAVSLLSGVVLTVQVTGNETVSDARILGELRRLGLRPGVYGPSLELRQLSQQALLSLDGLSWLTVNLYGTRAEVIVREAVPPPEVVDETGCYDVVARADGVVTEVEALEGEAMVEEGDVVLTGDVLISGTVHMKPPAYSNLPVRTYQTHARGRVWADTWRTLTARIPLAAEVKEGTEEEKRFHTLRFFGHSIEFYGNSSISWLFYDKITDVYPVVLPGGAVLPVGWEVQRVRAYQTRTVELDREAAQTLLEERLLSRLERLVGENGKICSSQSTAVVRDGWLTVTLQAQCQEEIGREVPANPE